MDPDNELKQLQIILPKYKNQKPYSTILREKFRESFSENIHLSSSEAEQSTSKSVDTAPDESIEPKIETDEIKENEDQKQNESVVQNETILKNTEEGSFPIISPIVNSPITDNNKIDKEKSEEGYGTDDNTGDDIDMERRKAFVDPDHDSFLNEELIEDEDDADTQVPNNISMDSLRKRNVRVRGGLNAIPGKFYIFIRGFVSGNIYILRSYFI